MPAEVKEVSVWWNGSVCPPPPHDSCRKLWLSTALRSACHSERGSRHLRCCSVQSPCVHGGHDADTFKCVCVCVGKHEEGGVDLIFDCIMTTGCPPQRENVPLTVALMYVLDV